MFDERSSPSIDALCIATIRTLAMDAVQQARLGHPEMHTALAPVAYTLWQRFMRFDPADPLWPNRDRFVLSNGHASMLLYAILHLVGVRSVGGETGRFGEAAVSLDAIRRFRQLDTRCPGHPEYGRTAGVESTTGPLGQGCGNSVGMAIAGRWLAEHFNRPGITLFDHDVYALCSDGDMMEGLTGEAASFAGHMQLANLCWIYDRSGISTAGSTTPAFTEDVAKRFTSYGWLVITVDDANDLSAIKRAIMRFRRNERRPTLIIVVSRIGYGAPQDEDEVRLAKRRYGWPENAHFLVPDRVYENFATGIRARGRRLRRNWLLRLATYRAAFPESAAALDRLERGMPPLDVAANLPFFAADAHGLTGCDASGMAMNAIAARYPWLVGGSTDNAPSAKTTLTFAGAGELKPGEPGGRNLHFGVREHAMGAILSGLALSKLRPFGGSFLIFSDYMKAAIRLAALMRLPVIYIMTHDSLAVGEDGPSHEPIEQLIGLRAIPGLVVLRPADANEVVEAWRVILDVRREPVCLVLSRQELPTFDRSALAPASGLARGAYVLADASDGRPRLILIGTGSEVGLCLAARERLAPEGIEVRVVSMPSWELFERQSDDYRESVLPRMVTARVAVEQGSTLGWNRYVGADGAIIGTQSLGASGPLNEVLERFGFTVEHVVQVARDQFARDPS